VATLSLAPDGRTLTVAVEDCDGQQSIDAQLRRLGRFALGADADLCALEVTRRPPGPRPFAFKKVLFLHDIPEVPFLSRADHPPLAASALGAMRPGTISGLPKHPATAAKASLGSQKEQPVYAPLGLGYLERRLADELRAAVTATLPVATSRHVELATLYARTIQILKEGPVG
jgi:hypothetical protein